VIDTWRCDLYDPFDAAGVAAQVAQQDALWRFGGSAATLEAHSAEKLADALVGLSAPLIGSDQRAAACAAS